MNRGYVKLWRKIEDSIVFQNEGLFKVFIWCLLQATHKEIYLPVRTGRGFTEVHLMPGSFIFGRQSAAKQLRMSQSTVWGRIIKLKKFKIIDMQTNTHYSIISIINWISYQGDQNQSDSQPDRQPTPNRRATDTNKNNKNVKNNTPAKISEKISLLQVRYSLNQEIINQAFQTISSTRKANRIADTVKLSILESWDRYPVEKVISGIRAYLSKDYAGQGKNEKYLLGIIRNSKVESAGQQEAVRSTGSALLDRYYREMGALNERA
jgi:hypothetical protein